MRRKYTLIILIFLILISPSLIFAKSSEEVERLLRQGGSAINKGSYQEAIGCFESSLKMSEELRMPEYAVSAFIGIALAYENLGQYEKALAYYKDALKITDILNIPDVRALILNNLGNIYVTFGYDQVALSYLEPALKLAKELEDQQHIATTLSNIGGAYLSSGQYEKALAYYEEALKIIKELNELGGIALTINNIGSVYSLIGQQDKALAYFDEALKIDTEINIPESMGIDFGNIASIYAQLGQYDKALYYAEESLKLHKQAGNPYYTGVVLEGIGEIYLSRKMYADAEKKFLEAEEEYKKTDIQQISLATYPNRVELYIAKGEIDNALIFLKKIEPEAYYATNPYLIQFYTQYGLALKFKGSLKEASHVLLKAVSLSEKIRQGIKEKTGFFEGGTFGGYIRSYRTLVSTLSERSLKNETKEPAFNLFGKDLASAAFYFSESTKARVLLDTLSRSAREYEIQELPPDLRKKEQDILNQLTAIDNIWEDTYKKGEEGFKILVGKKETLEGQLDSFISDLRKRYPKYASLKYPRPIPLEQIPLKDNEVLLEYALCDDAGYIFKARKDAAVEIIKIPKTKEEIENLVTEFCLPFESDLKTQTIPYQNFSLSQGKTLYDLLLAEALKDLSSNTNIIIVADGILGRLPFEALVVNPGSSLQQTVFVADKLNITYYQSATVLALNRMLQPSKAPKPLFALGNPIYSKNDPRYLAYKEGKKQPVLLAKDAPGSSYRALATRTEWGKTTKDDKEAGEITLGPLPETEGEIKSIAHLFNTKTAPPDILLGVFANETNLRKANLNQYRLLHFATHADLPGKVQGINEPFILLGQVENSGKDDGFLTLTKVLNLTLDADMVVLSACLTGRGKAMEGEGLLNFARAFHYAGARTVVVSLWEVSSESTAEYMKLFYLHLKEGKSKSEALSLARKEIKQKYPNPFFWAAFILHGEG